MHKLTLQNRHHRKLPARQVGRPVWCAEVKRKSLAGALESVENAKVTSADALHLLKIRKSLLAQIPRQNQATWLDPDHWNLED